MPGIQLVLVVTCLSCCGMAVADLEKFHGLDLDGKHRLQIVQEDGWLTIKLLVKSRADGGPRVYVNPKTQERDPVIRFGAEEVLMRVKSDVLVVAPPNYVKNPGQRYRVYVEGISILPLYTHVFEVDAIDALQALDNEFAKFFAQSFGIRRLALYYASMLTKNALNEAGRFPAQLPLTTLRSKAAQTRIQGQSMGRGKQGRVEHFTRVGEGQELYRDTKGETRLTSSDPKSVHGPAYGRGSVKTLSRSQPYLQKKYHYGEDLEPEDYRANQVVSLGVPKVSKRDPGRRGKALTEPELRYPAVAVSQIETLEMVAGSAEGIMEARISQQSKGESATPQHKASQPNVAVKAN